MSGDLDHFGGAAKMIRGTSVAFTAHGRPVTQGSLVRTKYGVRASNGDRLRPWRTIVTEAALDAMAPDGGQPAPRMEGPVRVELEFTFDRPKSAPKRRPCWPITRSSGDVDKLVRAVFDSLTDAGVWKDDSQVVEVSARKAHVGDLGALRIPGCVVVVWPVAS